jgi:hypothetical protein
VTGVNGGPIGKSSVRALLRQTLDQTFDSILEDGNVEVDQKTNRQRHFSYADSSNPGPSMRCTSIAAPITR